MTTYIYELMPTGNTMTRRVRMKSFEPDDTNAWIFQPARLNSEDLMTIDGVNTDSSVVETLVSFFTGKDPILMLYQRAEDCQHEDLEECNDTPVAVEIPTTLAYHIQQLESELLEHEERYREFNTKEGKRVRQETTDSGSILTSARTPNGVTENEANWHRFEVKEKKARRKILNRWLRTGVTLKAAAGSGGTPQNLEQQRVSQS